MENAVEETTYNFDRNENIMKKKEKQIYLWFIAFFLEI